MQSKAATVEQYLAELPADRRQTMEAVRQIILGNLDADFEEGMQYGMIGYYVPHRVYQQVITAIRSSRCNLAGSHLRKTTRRCARCAFMATRRFPHGSAMLGRGPAKSSIWARLALASSN